MRARFEVLADSPGLFARQAARMQPLALDIAAVVERKLRAITPEEVDQQTVTSAASTITAIAASLIIRRPAVPSSMPTADSHVPVPNPEAAAAGLEDLRWVWDRLI